MELEELSHKVQILLGQLEQLHDENEKIKHEKRQLLYRVEYFYKENEALKRELEAMSEKLKIYEMNSTAQLIPEREYEIKCSRILPYDADNDTLSDKERDNKKGGKKTSL